MGRTAFQFEIPRFSFRSRRGFDRVLWRFNYRAATRRPGMSSYPDSDRVLKDVHRRALFFRCCLRGGSGNSMRSASRIFFSSKSPGFGTEHDDDYEHELELEAVATAP